MNMTEQADKITIDTLTQFADNYKFAGDNMDEQLKTDYEVDGWLQALYGCGSVFRHYIHKYQDMKGNDNSLEGITEPVNISLCSGESDESEGGDVIKY